MEFKTGEDIMAKNQHAQRDGNSLDGLLMEFSDDSPSGIIANRRAD